MKIEKMNYESPTLRVTFLIENDIITTSLGDDDPLDGGFDGDNVDPGGWT